MLGVDHSYILLYTHTHPLIHAGANFAGYICRFGSKERSTLALRIITYLILRADSNCSMLSKHWLWSGSCHLNQKSCPQNDSYCYQTGNDCCQAVLVTSEQALLIFFPKWYSLLSKWHWWWLSGSDFVQAATSASQKALAVDWWW